MPLQLHKIASVEVASPASSIEFTSIPQGYTDLKLVVSARTTAAAVQQSVLIKINSLATGYADKYLYGSGSAAGSGAFGATAGFVGDTPSANATSNTFGSQEIYFPNYTSSVAKSWSIDSVAETNATAAYMELTAGYNSTTSAISSISVLLNGAGSLVQYSTATLYGIL